MEVHTSKLDNDLTLQIPLALASEIGLEPNSSVDISILGNSIIINPSRRPRRKLDDLLAGVTEDNLHGETDTGSAVGREVW